ncbi:hypothetical protein [Streptomyces sp. NPDC059786]|uniref:hypothetical protein n=1 Tax=Streptomyces sp. NPDC059786 TaxID=3346946 RepID=UPI0036689F71
MSDTEEPLYDGPDPFYRGTTAKWAAYLQTLPDVPRTLDAILTRVDDHWKAEAWLEIHAAEHGPELDRVLARWWRVARQWKSPEKLRKIITDIESGKAKTAPSSEASPRPGS